MEWGEISPLAFPQTADYTETMNTNLKLFLSFAKIGAFTFGGGYAMLPMLVREVQEKHGWVTEEELLNGNKDGIQ